MTRKKLGLGLLESFSEPCEVCAGRGIIVHHDPVTKHRQSPQPEPKRGRGRGGQQAGQKSGNGNGSGGGTHAITEDVKNALAQIAASTIAASTIAPVVELADQAPAASAPDAPSVEPTPPGAPEPPVGPESPTDPPAPADPETPAPQASSPDAEETVAILDIPVKKSSRPARRISSKDAEQLLDSVLDALPEPAQPGTSRSRTSRRATSAGLTGAPTE
jgi:ribonuclease E